MPSKSTIARTLILAVALVNQICTSLGYPLIFDLDDETINQLVNVAFTVVTALIAWWKNNSFTWHAIEADECHKALKEKDK